MKGWDVVCLEDVEGYDDFFGMFVSGLNEEWYIWVYILVVYDDEEVG